MTLIMMRYWSTVWISRKFASDYTINAGFIHCKSSKSTPVILHLIISPKWNAYCISYRYLKSKTLTAKLSDYMSTSCLLVSTGSVFACGNYKLASSDAYIKYRACIYCNNQAIYAVDRFFRIYIITDILIDIKLKFWRQLIVFMAHTVC